MRRPGGLFLITCLLLGGASASAAGATLEPTRFDDPPPGKCKPADCSLREAIGAANDRDGRDRITLNAGTYRMELPPDLGSNDDGQFAIVDRVVIGGLGPRETRIDAKGLDRVFVLDALEGKTVMQGLTIKGGDASVSGFHPNEGGGLAIFGEKTVLKDVAVRQNEAQFGGGIEADGPSLSIKGSTIARNYGQEGGGIDLRANSPQPFVSVRSSTISQNQAVNGGGVMVDGTALPPQVAPILDVDNSTIAGNMAFTSAGGVAGGQNAILVLDNTTVAYNHADSDGVGGGTAGGIFQGNGASFLFSDSVLAGNVVGDSGTHPACIGDFDAAGSLVEMSAPPNPDCEFVGLFAPTTTNSPLIGPLASNGGPTKTVKLFAGSPAIGLSFTCPRVDQRGKPRPEEGCDAGSFERRNP